MTLKAFVAGLALVLAASCSQPTNQPAPQPAALATTQEQRAAPAPQTATPTSSPAPQVTASAAGEYEGDFDGAGAAMTISGSAPRYRVHLIVGGDGCSGGAEGPASASSTGVLTVRPTDPSAAGCTITMTPTANGYSVAESSCSNLHGDTCAFSGEVHRKH